MQVNIGAGVEAADAVFSQRASGEHENGQIAPLLPHRFADGVAAHAGEHQVEDDQVDVAGMIVVEAERLGAVADHGDEISFGLEIVFDPDGQMFFIFDDQNVFHGDVAIGFAAGRSTSKIVP